MEPPQRVRVFPYPKPSIPPRQRQESQGDGDITLPNIPGPSSQGVGSSRWHVHLELRPDQLLELHRLGLTEGGALAWRAGMPSWQPIVGSELRAAAGKQLATAEEVRERAEKHLAAQRSSLEGLEAMLAPVSRGTPTGARAPQPRARLDSSRRIFTPSRARRATLPPIIARVMPVARPQSSAALPSVMLREEHAGPAVARPALPAPPAVAAPAPAPQLLAASAPPNARSVLPPLPQFPLALEGEPAVARRPISLAPMAMDVRVMSRPWFVARRLWMLALSFGLLSALTAAVVAVLVYGWRSGDGSELSLADQSAQDKCEPTEQGEPGAAAAARPMAVEQLPLVRSFTAPPASASVPASTQVEAAAVSADSLPLTSSEAKRAAPTRAERRAAAAAARLRAREAAAARRASRKTPAAVARDTAPPKRAVIAQALARAAGAAKSCGVGPQRGRVAVTFSPSGVVRAVQVEEAFDDRSVGSCVLRAMGRARVPEFAGEPLVVRRTVSW